MPVYEYRCSSGHQYEKTEGFDAPAAQPCPSCGSKAKRMISLPAVIFKGSGFYHTDNRKEATGGNGRSNVSTDSDSSTGSSAAKDDHGHSHDSGAGHSQDSTGDSAIAKVEAATPE